MRLRRSAPAEVNSCVAIGLGLAVGVAGLCASLWKGKIFSLQFIPEQQNSYTVPGLQNLGNNCFLNVILQALASTSCFLSFIQKILLSDDPVTGQKEEKMPLAVALSSLLEELCILRGEKSVLNPRRVMFAMSSYVSNFNLTRQQDSAEAFIHLLSAIEEEILDNYMQHDISLADITTSSSKIYKPNNGGQDGCVQWKQQIWGPFDGITGSFLTCKSCSSMLSIDCEFFRCLPLPPLLDRSTEFMGGYTVVDCLKQYTAVEHLDNYRCSRCWHAAALKYLSDKREMNEEKIRRLENCVDLDSCDCQKLFLEEEITWTGFSRALKQLRIAHCPTILCIHLQRASMNEYGEFIKLQGHISFPLFLDLFPFTVGQEAFGECPQKLEKLRPSILEPQLHQTKMCEEIHMLPHLFRIVNEKLSSETLSTNTLNKSASESLGNSTEETTSRDYRRDGVYGERIIHCPQVGSIMRTGLNNQVGKFGSSKSSKQCMYRLSSVVEHYGRPGSGHYAVYRRLASESVAVAPSGPSEASGSQQWFYVSDGEVSAVSEETVLAAEATLLFYEMV